MVFVWPSKSANSCGCDTGGSVGWTDFRSFRGECCKVGVAGRPRAAATVLVSPGRPPVDTTCVPCSCPFEKCTSSCSHKRAAGDFPVVSFNVHLSLGCMEHLSDFAVNPRVKTIWGKSHFLHVAEPELEIIF